MKLKTNIARLLATGLLLNNIYFYSNANTLDNEIPGRYETLEGEYITIDDSIEGNLEEIEIFGNTIQNPNNLEDIQSVGDLHVDEEGEPILDSQGRKQYKVDILSGDYFYRNELKNPDLSSYPFYRTVVEDEWNVFTWNLNDYYVSSKDTITGGSYNYGDKTYVRFDVVKLSDEYYTGSTWCSRITGYSNVIFDGNFYNNLPVNEVVTVSAIDTHNAPDSDPRVFKLDFGDYRRDIECKFKIRNVVAINLTKAYGKGNEPTKEWCDKNIQYKNDNNIYWNQLHKTTILLPCQLQKVGDMMDRLYWDDTKNRYMIDKVVLKDIKEDVLKVSKLVENDTHIVYRVMLPRAKYPTENTLFSLKKIDYNCDNLGETGYGTFYTDSTFYIKLSVPKDENIVDFINSNSFIYANGDTEIVKTNITSKFKIPTYEGKTYVFAETGNSISPVLKVVADRLPQIAQNAIEDAENDSTSYNISLARMYVNMLPESLYKDQLHEQLNQVFSSDITLDRETASANLDIYVKSENMLSLSLNTSSVTFEGYSGVEDVEMLGAVSININSSLPYSLNVYMPVEIANSDKSNILPMNLFNIKESSESDYKQFTNTTDKIILKDGNIAENNSIHNIDLKLSTNLAHKADVYKTVIKFEAEQK